MAIDKAVIDELVLLRASARLAAEDFSEAIKAQAEKHEIAKGALRRFVCAVEKDALAALSAEFDDLAALMTKAGGGE